MVSEAGASVYSASELASNELPDLDVSLRGAVSIARRLQDPLAELVKIDPKSIGVGQYQHDVSQVQLARSLDNVVEDCVNAVGVDVNTASPALLRRVAGLSETVADNILAFRDQNGTFPDRQHLKKVPRLGDKTFEQAAGFLRVMNGSNPLDASAVHPEAYPVVQRILQKNQRPIASVIGDGAFLRRLKVSDYIDQRFGAPTVQDIIAELEKPGRDPRPEFKTAEFQDGVETLADLKPGMVLEGVVTNVTNFGAFVDVGVHQDGLVHISAMSEKFVKDPHEVVKTGQVIKVKVMEIDLDRKRVGLSMRLADMPGRPAAAPRRERDARTPRKPDDRRGGQRQGAAATAVNSAFAEAFAKARKG
jgi:protein Tex